MRNHLFVINCRLRKKTQNCPKTSVFDQKTAIPWSIFPEKKRKTVPRTNPNFLRKQAFRHRRCHFVRGKLPYFLPCAAHMKIRESSTLKFITKNFSAKHHNNFSAQRSDFHSARSGKTIPLALPILARRAIIFSAQRDPTESSAQPHCTL